MSKVIEESAPVFSNQMLVAKDGKLTLKNGQEVTVSAINFCQVVATEVDGQIWAIATSMLSVGDKKLVEEHTEQMNLRRTVQQTKYHHEENE